MGRLNDRQLDLFAPKAKRAAARSPIAPRSRDERRLIEALEGAAKPKPQRYSSAHVRRLMTPLPRITVLDPPKRQRRSR
jgi:hypothetical protein